MRRYVLGRVFQAGLALLGVTCVAFLLVSLSGDPAFILLTPEAGDEQRAAFRQMYGLDQPLPVQYAQYIAHVVRGDFGRSFAFERPALTVVMERVPATLELTCAALLLGIGFGIPAGVIAAAREGTWFDRGVMAVVLLGQSVPTFWLGLLMIRIFAVNLHWLPVSGRGTFAHLVLPAVSLGAALAATLARMTRATLLEELREPYVLAARARGVSRTRAVLGHAFRNSLIPVVTIVGLQFGAVLTGAVITETIFAWPGIGRLLIQSIGFRDYPLVQGCILLIALTYVGVNLLTDVLYGVLDPRIRYE